MRERTEFSDPQRAAIFVRDRATCCFSGANLWLLDAPLRPGYERDWVDHILPAARGGKSEVENGVCASHTFNGKKRHNTADHLYLFECGLPTDRYYGMFGSLPPEQEARLHRLAHLVPADWYFNRALGLAMLGFEAKARKERYKEHPSRDAKYWFKAAFRKLAAGQLIPRYPTLEERWVIEDPTDQQRAWLCLRELSSEREVCRALEAIYPRFRANFRPWASYFYAAETAKARLAALLKAEASPGVSPETLACIRGDYELRYPTAAPTSI